MDIGQYDQGQDRPYGQDPVTIIDNKTGAGSGGGCHHFYGLEDVKIEQDHKTDKDPPKRRITHNEASKLKIKTLRIVFC
jgi:hypothetical protein